MQRAESDEFAISFPVIDTSSNSMTSAKVKLEKFSIAQIRSGIVLLVLINAASIALGTIISVSSTVLFIDRVSNSLYGAVIFPQQRKNVAEGETILRTLAAAVLGIILILFPQAYIRHAIKTKQIPRADQIMLVSYIVIMSLTPAFSLYSIYAGWNGLNNFAKIAGVTSESLYLSFYNTSPSLWAFSIFVGCSWLVFFQYFLYFFNHFEGFPYDQRKEAEKKRMESLNKEDLRKISHLEKQLEKQQERLSSHRLRKGEGEDFYHPRLYIQPLKQRIISTCSKFIYQARIYLLKHRQYLGANLFIAFLFCFYYSLLLGLTYRFQFQPSYVPFVALITVIRVCALNPQYLVSIINGTLVTPNGINLTSNFYSPVDPGYAVCSPSQPVDNNAFYVTLSVCFLTAFEIFFFYHIWRKNHAAIENLRFFSYALTRTNQISFAYFNTISWISMLCYFVLSIEIAILEPVQTYIVNGTQINSTSLTTIAYARPLFQVGITPNVIGFSCLFFIFVFWLGFLAYGFLPPISVFCLSSNTNSDEDDSDVPEEEEKEPKKLRQVILISTEKDLIRYLYWKTKRRSLTLEGSTSSPKPKYPRSVVQSLEGFWTRKYRRSNENLLKSLAHHEQQLQHPEDSQNSPEYNRYLLSLQIQSRAFVLETQILLFHFMSLSYDLVGTANSEEQEKMIENPSFKLNLYASDSETDTHGFVFSSSDRIVVAFRGSVSLKNFQTDWDSSEVESEYGKQIEPLLDDEVNFSYAKTVASRPAYLHGGFVKAYETIREKIVNEVKSLYPNKCVFVTGHSLGAGLAVVCALDLAMQINIPPNRIAMSLWGCPKVGTFSFVKRVARKIPCTHRIATANDIITQLPFQNPLNAYTLKGWFYVGTEVLLLPDGNLLLDPNPVEKFMLEAPVYSMVAHFRVSYALSLASWVIRFNPEMHADWWNSTIHLFLRDGDFQVIPKQIRELLLWDIRRPGIEYILHDTLVRDMAVDTCPGVMEGYLKNLDFIQQLQRVVSDTEEFEALIKNYVSSSANLTDPALQDPKLSKLKEEDSTSPEEPEHNGDGLSLV